MYTIIPAAFNNIYRRVSSRILIRFCWRSFGGDVF
jgi:hypothetical protein